MSHTIPTDGSKVATREPWPQARLRAPRPRRPAPALDPRPTAGMLAAAGVLCFDVPVRERTFRALRRLSLRTD